MTGPHVTEAEWQGTVVELAQRLGWKVAHFRPARTANGWRTAVAYDGAGFPDLVLVRDRVIFAELKSDRGRVTEAQRDWLRDLDHAGVEARVWWPRDFEDVARTLTRRDDR